MFVITKRNKHTGIMNQFKSKNGKRGMSVTTADERAAMYKHKYSFAASEVTLYLIKDSQWFSTKVLNFESEDEAIEYIAKKKKQFKIA